MMISTTRSQSEETTMTDTFIEEISRKHNAAQTRADVIAEAFVQANGIKLNNRPGGTCDDLFYLCYRNPELPDHVFAEWLAQAHSLPTAKRQKIWKLILANQNGLTAAGMADRHNRGELKMKSLIFRDTNIRCLDGQWFADCTWGADIGHRFGPLPSEAEAEKSVWRIEKEVNQLFGEWKRN